MKNIYIILIVFFAANSYAQLENKFVSKKWNYSIQYPKEFYKSTFSELDPPMTELHLADGKGRSIIITSQRFSTEAATDLDKLTKEEQQADLNRLGYEGHVFKFYRATIGGRKRILSACTVTVFDAKVTNLQYYIYNGQCLILVVIGTNPNDYKKEESDYLKIISSIKFY